MFTTKSCFYGFTQTKIVGLFSKKSGIVSGIFLVVIAFSFLVTRPAHAAPIDKFPVTVTQPDGTVLNLFASGDEYYNWLQDAQGFTVIQDPVTGYYVYANLVGGNLIPTNFVVGRVNPASVGLQPYLNVSPAQKTQIRQAFLDRTKQAAGEIKNAPHTGTINNLVVFIRFSDETEFTNATSTYTNMLNDSTADANSLRNYYREVSYNALTVDSTLYPTPGTTVISYQDGHPRGYYQPYNASTNTIGYQESGTERRDREHTLLHDAITYVNGLGQFPSGTAIDGDNDGLVDGLTFIVSGGPTAWGSLLWPHQWNLYTHTVTIDGKTVGNYSFHLNDFLTAEGTGVLAHELFHTLGAPDLYHYSYDGLAPVGGWDVMENTGNPPQHMGCYMKFKYGNWISSIEVISTIPGSYTLNPLTSSTNNCYKIASPNSATEYFVVEYRRKTGPFESSLPGTGLLVYRINTAVTGGNRNGPPDEVYIYRSDGTNSVNGSVNTANFSSNVGRTLLNDGTDPSGFLSNGSAGGLNICYVGYSNATISFNLCPPVTLYTISGYVRTATLTGISGVTMSGLIHHPVTDASGFYTDQVYGSWSGIVTPRKTAYIFDPIHLDYTSVNSDQLNQNYTGQPPLVSAGGYHTCRLKADGTLACWGNNGFSQSTPPAGTFTQVSAGTYHTCGLKSDGTLACWGANSDGQSTPPAGTFAQVSAGSRNTCGLKSNGTLACWGYLSGIYVPPGGVFFQISSGGLHACGLKSDGTLACWGVGTTNTGSDPQYGQAIPPSGTFIQVSAGFRHTCGLEIDGTLACWGAGTTNTGSDPQYGQAIPPSGTFIQVSAGKFHTCGLKSDGTLACWGAGITDTGMPPNYGQAIPPAGTFTQISAGDYHTCGLKSNGSLVCWGNNSFGQLYPVIHVTTTTDAIAADGSCSLREAIRAANTNVAVNECPAGSDIETDTIVLEKQNYNLAIAGANEEAALTGDLDILDNTVGNDLIIYVSGGGPAVIDASGIADRVLHIQANADVVIADVTISGGNSVDNGGGIYNAGRLFIFNSTVINNAATEGGGIYNYATLNLDNNSSISDNTATYGGGIRNHGTAVLSSTTVSSNTAFGGGGIMNFGTLTIQGGSLIGGAGAGNSAGWGGAGLYHQSGSLTVDASTVSANTTTGSGGGIFNLASVTIRNGSLIGGAGAGNSAAWGGGIYNDPGGILTVDSSTVSANTATGGGGILNKATMTIQNGSTIGGAVAGNTATIIGGGLQTEAGTVTITGSRFLYNAAGSAGGAIYNNINSVNAVSITGSCITGNGSVAFYNNQASSQIASGNWWGRASGPGPVGPGQGDTVSSNVDFSGYLAASILDCPTLPVSISGNVGVAGATLSYIDGTPKTATADGGGLYSFTVSYNWSGTVTPSKTGYTFSPVSRPYTNVLANQTGQNYTATLTNTYWIYLPLVVR